MAVNLSQRRELGVALAALPLGSTRPTVAHATGGSGLGLSIAQAVVEAHGGTATAASAVGGSHFTIELPAAP
jgi:signal transduction histidine kinase